MLPCNHSKWIYGDVIGPKYPFVFVVNGRGMPKSLQAISKLMSSIGIGYLPNLIPKMAVQYKGRIAYSP